MRQNLPYQYLRVIFKWMHFNHCNFLSGFRLPEGYSPRFTIPNVFGPTFPSKWIIGCVMFYDICNLDRTLLPFEFFSGHKYNINIVNSVEIKVTKSGYDKRQVTLILTIFTESIARIVHLLIFKAISDWKCNCAPTKREKHFWEYDIYRYFLWVKLIYNDNAYTSEKVISV